jgi:hypothetical protein
MYHYSPFYLGPFNVGMHPHFEFHQLKWTFKARNQSISIIIQGGPFLSPIAFEINNEWHTHQSTNFL